MRLLYVDDSGHRKPGGEDPYFCLDGLSIDGDYLPHLRARLNNLKRKYRLASILDDEVRFNQIARNYDTKKRPNPLVRVGHDFNARRTFGFELLQILCRVPTVQVFSVGIKLDTLDSHESCTDWAIKLIYERFQYYLAQQKDFGIVICDEEEQKDEDMRRAVADGTAFTEMDRLNDPVLFAPSHLSAGVQCADFVAGSTGRWWNYRDDSYLLALHDVIYRGTQTHVKGAGMKSFRLDDYPTWT